MLGPFRVVLTLFMLAATCARDASAQDWLNVRLNDDTTNQLQNEEQVVVNPANPSNLVAVWRDFRLGYRQVGWAYTLDGGRTWTNPGLFDDPHYARDSDPALTVNADGDFFAVLLGYTGNTSEENGLLCYRSQDMGQSWEFRGFPVNQVPNVFEDKEFVACDRTSSGYRGRLYTVWARFFEQNIYCVASGDEGASWIAPRRVSDISSVQFPTPAVGSDGTFFCAWTQFSSPSIRIDRSFDGGLTFGSDRVVTTLTDPFPTLNGGIGAPAHPAMDIDITGGVHDGRIYIAYIDRVSSSDHDVYIRHSDDDGESWSTRRRINDDPFNNGRDQFHPWLTVDNLGIVSVVWLDRRHDPSNLEWHCYISQSTDGGLTWSPNQQVSTQPSHPFDARTGPPGLVDADANRRRNIEEGPELPGWLRRVREEEWDGRSADAGSAEGAEGPPEFTAEPDQSNRRAGLIGEYIGVASWDGFATTVWTDTRNGHQDTYGGVDPSAVGVDPDGVAVAPRLRVSPNPADGPIVFSYEVAEDGFVSLDVFDVVGRRVRTLVSRRLRSGGYRFVWDGTNQDGERVAAGAYWIRFQGPGAEETLSVRVHS